MRKQIRKLSLHRETLLQLDAGELAQVAGADQQPLYTTKLPPTKSPTCLSNCTC